MSLRRLALSDLDGNRFWLHCTALALNLPAPLNDVMVGPEPPGHLPRRRHAKWLRRMLVCVPARIVHHARQIILRLPAGLPSAPAYNVARRRAPPALA